jgi:hypothetical protein
MTDHDNRSVLEGAIRAMLQGDFRGMTEAMAEDAVLEWPQSGERIVGRQACYMVYANYPGGPPTYELSRITGSGELFTIEAVGDYSGEKVFLTSIVQFHNGKIARQTDYWSNPFEPPAWRAQWVERMEPV